VRHRVAIGGGEQFVEVRAGAEVLPLTPQDHDTHVGVEIGALQSSVKGVDQGRAQRVPLGGPIEREGEHPVREGRADGRRRVHHSRRKRRASATGTGISILSSAVEYTLPWASVFNEIVPPPSSASWRRKLSACRLGSSKRSTPLTMPLKCFATRATV